MDANERVGTLGARMLRVALIGAIYVAVMWFGTGGAMPGLAHWTREILRWLQGAGTLVSVVAPVLAILGGVLTITGTRRIRLLDVVCFLAGMSAACLPLLILSLPSLCQGGKC